MTLIITHTFLKMEKKKKKQQSSCVRHEDFLCLLSRLRGQALFDLP